MAFILIHFDDCEDREEVMEYVQAFTEDSGYPMAAVLVPEECEEGIEALYNELDAEQV